MKALLILTFILPFICKSQDSLTYKSSYDNSLTGAYARNTTTTTTLTYVGNNSININKIGLTSNTTYSLGHNPYITQNELTQKTNIGFNGSKYFSYIGYQYNYSFLRKINSYNLIGFGLAIYKEVKQFKISLSYGVIYQNTHYFKIPQQYNLRHSVRAKILYEFNTLNFSTEYYYQPSMLNSNIIINGTTKITFKFYKYLNLTIQDVVNFSSTSAVPMIHNLTLGLSYSFKNSKKIAKN